MVTFAAEVVKLTVSQVEVVLGAGSIELAVSLSPHRCHILEIVRKLKSVMLVYASFALA